MTSRFELKNRTRNRFSTIELRFPLRDAACTGSASDRLTVTLGPLSDSVGVGRSPARLEI